MIDTNPVKIYDEEGVIVDKKNPCIFPDTVVESFNDRVYSIHNTTKYTIELIPDNTDPTIEYLNYPTKMHANSKAKFIVRYHPTFEHLKPTESLIGFSFRVL